MPIRYGTREEELAICREWEAWLLAELTSVRAVLAGLETPMETELEPQPC